MNKKYIIIIFLLLCFNELSGQSLKIVRTDVDTSRSNFVTATFLFGFDIYLEDIEKCRGISFRLDYDQIDFIHFSEYSMVDFGESALAVVHNKLDQLAKRGSLYVGIGINDEDDDGIDNPKVIHLEFGVSQSVEHGKILTLDFQNIFAVVTTETGREIINIEKDPTNYTIHSFVDVWPGDADDDGDVDENDFIPINYYMGYGSATKNMRSFKRRSASTIWAPHKVLAWDAIPATYADCDGNGDVTVTDLLVVNMHLPKKIEKKSETPLNSIFKEKCYSKEGTHAIPIYIGKNDPYTGVAGRISWDHFPDNVKVLGLERGDAFTDEYSFFLSYVNEEEKNAQIAFINTNKNDFAQSEAVLAYLIVENGLPELSPKVDYLMGASPFGYLFPLGSLTNVEENENHNNCLKFEINSDQLHFISSCEKVSLIEIYDIMGRKITSKETNRMNPNEIFIGTGHIPSGLYYGLIHFSNRAETIPFSILR
jgi:hypothetical protein